MEIDIEGKLPYTHILIELMRDSLDRGEKLTASNRLVKEVFEELGLKK